MPGKVISRSGSGYNVQFHRNGLREEPEMVFAEPLEGKVVDAYVGRWILVCFDGDRYWLEQAGWL